MTLRGLPVLFAAFIAGIVVLTKVLVYPDCYSFDSHDEANHAFPGLHVARQAIQSGELPTVNFYNNFGAPLLGDALTYPFAIQALTYYFLDNHIAMTVNRFVIAVATVIAAFGFFRIYLAVFPALVCAVLVFFNPVAFWYPVHQYQMAAPFFLGSFWLIDRFYTRPSALHFSTLFVVFCGLILSVSINHVVLMVPFLVVWGLCRNHFRLDRVLLAPLVALICAVVASYPQTLEFARSFLASARAGEGVYDGILNTPRELFLGLAIPPAEWIPYNYGAQLQVTTYLSMPVMLAVTAGAWQMRSEAVWKQASLLFCGIVPTVVAIALYVSSDLRLRIPLVKSGDITRVFWFSLPFCYVYVGYLITSARLGSIPRSVAAALLLGALLTLVAFQVMPEAAVASALHSVSLGLLAAGVLAMFLGRQMGGLSFCQTGGAWLLICSLILVPVPVIVRVLGLNTGYCGGTQYSDGLAASRFTPHEFLGLMQKGNRLATEIHTHKGHDLRVAPHGILGSDARGIVVDKKFGRYLEDRRLVTVDQVPYGYYFSRPWQTDELSRLGIRYLLVERSPDPELERKGWERQGQAGGLSLYENPAKPTPVYLIQDHRDPPLFVRDYTFSATRIRISVPQLSSAATLVVTILNRHGFEATIEGRRATIIPQESGFIGVHVHPGDKIVELRHRPYSWAQVMMGVGLALALSALYGWFLVVASRRCDDTPG